MLGMDCCASGTTRTDVDLPRLVHLVLRRVRRHVFGQFIQMDLYDVVILWCHGFALGHFHPDGICARSRLLA